MIESQTVTLCLVFASVTTTFILLWASRAEESSHVGNNGRSKKDGIVTPSKPSTPHGNKNDKTAAASHRDGGSFSTEMFQSIPPHVQRQLYKDRRRDAKIPSLAMKSPMYDNIAMLDPRGMMLSTISIKKAQWYVSKKLAEWKTPSSIQIQFEPSCRSDSDKYTVSPKDNCCVACGASGHMMRHYIIPHAYRSQLPEEYKSHQSHDVVILCPKCHLNCERAYHEHRNQLEENLRHDPSTAAPSLVDPHKQHIRSAALALLRWKNKLPAKRIDEYEMVVREHLGLSCNHPLSLDQLQEAIDVKYITPNPKYISGAELVANHLIQGGHQKIAAFVVEWRDFFLQTVQPRHLPNGWRVDAPVMCRKRSKSTP